MSDTDTQDDQRRVERIDTDAPSGTIEKQIDEKRANINRTLNALEERFSPGQMFDQTLGMVRDNGGEVAQNLGRSFRDNPMPFLLTGIGIAWAMAASSSPSGASAGRYRSRYGYGEDYAGRDVDDGDYVRGYVSAYDRDRARDLDRGYAAGRDGESDLQPRYTAGNYASSTGAFADESDDGGRGMGDRMRDGKDQAERKVAGAGSRIGEAKDNLVENISGMSEEAADRYRAARTEAAWRRDRMQDDARRRMDSMRRRGRELGARGRRQAMSAADSVSDFVQEQPMIAGAFGVAVGALIGSLLPASRIEDEYLGEHADTAKQHAQQKAEEGMRHVREEAEGRMEGAQGDAESGMENVRSQVENVARSAREMADEKLDEADRKAREDEKSGPIPGVDTESSDGETTDKTNDKTVTS